MGAPGHPDCIRQHRRADVGQAAGSSGSLRELPLEPESVGNPRFGRLRSTSTAETGSAHLPRVALARRDYARNPAALAVAQSRNECGVVGSEGFGGFWWGG